MDILSDTSPDIAQLQLELLRKASPRARGAAIVALTDFARANARRAIAAANPHLSRDEQDIWYAEAQYGKELADELRRHWKLHPRQAVSSTGRRGMLSAIRPVIAVLEQLSIPYYVGGSVASSTYGQNRLTNDVDIVVDMHAGHIKPFLDALGSEFYGTQTAAESDVKRQASFNVIHLPSMFKVDLFILADNDYDREAMRRMQRGMIGTEDDLEEVWLASAEDVILSKLRLYRLGNEVSQVQWSDITAMLKVRNETLDFEYLQCWAEFLMLDDLLIRARGEIGE